MRLAGKDRFFLLSLLLLCGLGLSLLLVFRPGRIAAAAHRLHLLLRSACQTHGSGSQGACRSDIHTNLRFYPIPAEANPSSSTLTLELFQEFSNRRPMTGRRRVRLQPSSCVLFRPEEVVLPSAATPIDIGLGRRDFAELTSNENQVDALGTVGARIIYHHSLVTISAADQQQEVYCSGHVELLATFQGDGVEVEAQAFQEMLVAGG